MANPIRTVGQEIDASRADNRITKNELLRISVAANMAARIGDDDKEAIGALVRDIRVFQNDELSSVRLDSDAAKVFGRFKSLALKWSRSGVGEAADITAGQGWALMALGGAVAGGSMAFGYTTGGPLGLYASAPGAALGGIISIGGCFAMLVSIPLDIYEFVSNPVYH